MIILGNYVISLVKIRDEVKPGNWVSRELVDRCHTFATVGYRLPHLQRGSNS